ncbi:MAG: KH domain-containing protein [Chthoniobacteraceae bacterium]|nr:KH domain-containing protein [Chthoniobacteraceae bacterium]
MEEFLRYLILNLVGTPEGMELTQSHGPHKTLFRLKLPPAEIGKMIGKQGRTIESIRNLLSASASRHGEKASLQIVEE